MAAAFDLYSGGSGEIRTHEGLPLAGFQDRCNRPLCHTSEGDESYRQPSHLARELKLSRRLGSLSVQLYPWRKHMQPELRSINTGAPEQLSRKSDDLAASAADACIRRP